MGSKPFKHFRYQQRKVKGLTIQSIYKLYVHNNIIIVNMKKKSFYFPITLL